MQHTPSRWTLTGIALALAGSLAAGLLPRDLAFAEAGPETDQAGKTYDLDSGPSVTVVDFAASWCEPCWKTLPKLQTLADAMPNVRFIVVDVDEKVSGRDRLVDGLKLRVPVVWDEKQRLAQRFGPEGMPATFVLDAAGKVVYKHVGSESKEWNKLVAFLEARKS